MSLKPWHERALQDRGLHETGANPRILAMFRNTGVRTGTDATPWCAAGMSTWLEEAGYRSPRTAWARDFLKWGVAVEDPESGDIAVLSRNGSGGHVAIFEAWEAGRSRVRLFGGNQRDSACSESYDASRVLGFRRPGPNDVRTPAASPIMEPPAPVAARQMVEQELRQDGSQTIRNADNIQNVGTGMTIVTSLLLVMRQFLDAMKPLMDYAWVLLVVFGVLLVYYAKNVKTARVGDAMSGRHIGRAPDEDQRENP